MTAGVRKFRGKTGWVSRTKGTFGESPVERAILHLHGKLVLDTTWNDKRYTVTLTGNEHGVYLGRYEYRSEGQRYEGPVRCRMFKAGDDVFLFGEWREDDDVYVWWLDLESVSD